MILDFTNSKKRKDKKLGRLKLEVTGLYKRFVLLFKRDDDLATRVFLERFIT